MSTTAAKTQAGPQKPSSAQYRHRKLGHSFLLRHGRGWPGVKSRKKKNKTKTHKKKKRKTADEPRHEKSTETGEGTSREAWCPQAPQELPPTTMRETLNQVRERAEKPGASNTHGRDGLGRAVERSRGQKKAREQGEPRKGPHEKPEGRPGRPGRKQKS